MAKRQSKRTPTSPSTVEVPSVPRVQASRQHWVLLAIVIAVGIVLRIAHWSLTTVEHFDEGVYASNLWFGELDSFRYPQQHFYAPPLVPWLIEWTMILGGRISGHAAIVPSLAASVATIGVVWWLARNTVGNFGSLVAAMLAACSGTHILLSRAALTDATLLLWFVMAIGFFERACRTLRWRDFSWMGILVGLAWWTKYNGWLPLMVAAASLAVRFALCPAARYQARRLIAGWCLAAAIAFAIWSPYLLSLQSRGGYSAIAANHRQYVVGFSGWWNSLTRQLANVAYINTWSNADLTSLAVGAAGTAILCFQLWASRRDENWQSNSGSTAAASGESLIVAWYCGLGVLTPLYTPYPRLLLPWLAASWIASGGCCEMALRRFTVRSDPSATTKGKNAKRGWQSALLLSICIGFGGWTTYSTGRSWSDRRGLRDIAQKAAATINDSGGANRAAAAIYVFGEPALLFQLRVAGVEPVVPIQSLDLLPATSNGVPVPTYLAVGPHALRDRAFQAAWPAAESRYEFVAKFPYEPSALVVLDNYSPQQLASGKLVEEVRLYRIK